MPNTVSSNVGTALEILKDVAKIGESIPYLEGIAGVLSTVLKAKDEMDLCKDEWEEVAAGLSKIQGIVDDFRSHRMTEGGVIPEHIKSAFTELEGCIKTVLETQKTFLLAGRTTRFFKRRELLEAVKKCRRKVSEEVQSLSIKLQVKQAAQTDDMWHAIVGQSKNSDVTFASAFAVPGPSRVFTGREAQLKALASFLLNPQQADTRRIVTVTGKGGSGKTQLILQLVDKPEFKSRFDWLFFVDASSAETLAAAYTAIAQAAKIGDSADSARLWLSGLNEEWLLVLDNADDPNLNLGRYIPHSTHGSVIVTSRNVEIGVHASDGGRMDLPDLDVDDAIDLLLRRARCTDSDENRRHARDIVCELGCLALAVSSAGTYISQSQTCRLSDYLPLLKQRGSKLLNRRTRQSSVLYEHTVYSTWQLSFQKLSNRAKLFVQICSFFHHSRIPAMAIFRLASAEMSTFTFSLKDDDPTMQDILQNIRNLFTSCRSADGFWDASGLDEILRELQNFSLVDWNEDKEFPLHSFHPLLHSCARDTVSDVETFGVVALGILASCAPFASGSKDGLLLGNVLWPHVNHAWNDQISPDAIWYIALPLADIYDGYGHSEKALALKLAALCSNRLRFGDEHTDTLRAMGNLANTYRNLGRWQEAEKLEVSVLASRKRLLGDEHPDTLLAMGNLAATYHNLGRWQEAEKLEMSVVASRKRLLGDEHPHTLFAMANLAGTYRNLGRRQEAEKLEVSVLASRKRLLGDEHPDTLIAMGNLAATYRNLGRWQEAEKLEVSVLALRKRLLGDEHPDTLRAMGNLAATYRDLGRWQEAEKLEMSVVASRKRLLGDEHPHTLIAMANLANTYRNLGRWQEAEKLEVPVLASQKRLLGDEHPDTLFAMANLAGTYRNLGRWQEAEKLEESVLASRKRLLGDEHPDTLYAMANLTATYRNLGRWQEAEKLDVSVLTSLQRQLGDEHPDTLYAMANLAATYRKLGRLQESEKLEVSVVASRKWLLGDEHPHTLTAMANLAATYRKLGRWQEAEELGVSVLASRKRLLGVEHPNTLLAMAELADTYRDLSRWTEAEVLYLSVITSREQLLGKEHPATLTARRDLATTYRALGRLQDAEKLSASAVASMQDLLGEEHPDTLSAMSSLATTYCGLDRWHDAQKLQLLVVASWKRLFGDDHPDTLIAIAALAATYRSLGCWQEAEKLEAMVVSS